MHLAWIYCPSQLHRFAWPFPPLSLDSRIFGGPGLLRLLGLLLIASAANAADPAPGMKVLVGAHAHNDYVHSRPLLEALENGFQSVEADIHWTNGSLQVGHDTQDLRKGRTLESLYLDPLRARVRHHGGNVYHPGDGFCLLIDVKTEAHSSHQALTRVLRRYRDILTRFGPDGVRTGAVTVVISGERALRSVASESVRWWALDGRLPDLDSATTWQLAPWISASWIDTFEWRGEGECPAGDLAKLQSIVTRCHAQGRRLRFWATGDRPQAWRFLQMQGVDILGTDHLAELRQFLLNEIQRRKP